MSKLLGSYNSLPNYAQRLEGWWDRAHGWHEEGCGAIYVRRFRSQGRMKTKAMCIGLRRDLPSTQMKALRNWVQFVHRWCPECERKRQDHAK
jgi:hypothetical protein